MNDRHTNALFNALERHAEHGVSALRRAHATIAELERRVQALEADNQRLKAEAESREAAPSAPRSQGLAALMARRPRFAAKSQDMRPSSPAAPSPSPEQSSEPSPHFTTAEAETPGACGENVVGTDASGDAETSAQSRLPIGEAPSPQALLDEWYQRYPGTFFKGHTRPLKVGIHEDLVAREPWPDKLVRRALACYVHLPRYLKAVRTGAERVGIDGENAGEVSEGEARYARRQLDELRAQNRSRKAQQAQRQAQREKESRLDRKLGELLAKHERPPSSH